MNSVDDEGHIDNGKVQKHEDILIIDFQSSLHKQSLKFY